MKPIIQLVNDDVVATRAIAKLRSRLAQKQIRLSDRVRRSSVTTTFVPFSLTVDEETNFHSPPYDSEWFWGNASEHRSNRADGFLHIQGDSGNVGGGTSDRVASACGIGSHSFPIGPVRPKFAL
jgi:hypothetical protein